MASVTNDVIESFFGGFVRGLPSSTSAPRGGVQKSADFADKQSYRSADEGGRGSTNRPILRTNSLTEVRTRGGGPKN